MERKEELIRLFSMQIRSCLEKSVIDFKNLYEIRLRVNQPMIFNYKGQELFLKKGGGLSTEQTDCYIVQQKELKETLEYISNFSLYAFEEEIKKGFITVQGGHRIGLAGKAFLEQSHVKGMKYISYINIRISHEIKGCANQILPYLVNGKELYHTLIISPPRCGKTTLLRDCIRQISNGACGMHGMSVGVIDERSELGGSYFGVLQNDLGMRTDVLDCCPKPEGIMMLLRSMSPAVIAVDEIGGGEDAKAIENALFCGCKILATIHGNSLRDIEQKPLFRGIADRQIFQRYVVLKGQTKAGQILDIYDARGKSVKEGFHV